MRLTPAVRAIFGLEIRSLLRDVRTVMVSLVLPVILLPALLLASNWMEDRRVEREETRTYRFAVSGSDSILVDRLVQGIRAGTGPTGTEDRFHHMEPAAPMEALEREAVDVHVETLAPEEWDEVDEEEREQLDIPEHLESATVIRLHYHSNRTASREGANLIRDRLLQMREEQRDSLLVAFGFPVPPDQVARMERENVATQEEVQGARLGRFLTLILMGLMLLGGSAVATDTMAGEKERGTLTTLLTSAASRQEIVTGKLLAIMAVAMVIAVVQILNLWIYLGLGVIEASEGFAATISPSLALSLFALYLPVITLTAGVLLLTSAHARSYKEAQLYLTPVLLGMGIPALAPLLPDIALRSAIMVVPIANLAVAARDLLVGQVDGLGLIVSWAVTAGAAVWVTARSVKALHNEELITGDTSREEFLGGPDLFRKRVLRWFLVFWAVKILLDFNLPFQDLRVLSLISVGLVFTAFPLLVIRQFRLDPRKALALRMPRAGAWLGVLIGAPSALVAANFFFRLMDHVLPMPTELVENFGQSLLPEEIPLWQLIVFIAVIPGIAEELTFRGVLLHGLRRRFGPVGLALVVGLIFGFFHFQIFRIPSTALLGVILTAVTLLTGSVFPAMVWHFLNNALAVYLGSHGVDLMAASWLGAVGSLLGLVAAFWALWMFRTPYPDVGPPHRTSPAIPEREP